MFNRIQNYKCTARVSRKLLLVVAVLFANLFFTRAQAAEDTRVYFRFDSPVVDASYLSNPQAFAEIDARLSAGYDGSLEVVAFSSPEGNFTYNAGLSRRRAESLRRYILARYPAMDGRISVNPDTESWDDLRADVVADTRISESSRSAILGIIDSSLAPDTKEARLKALRDWNYFYSQYFRTLRFATVRFIGGEASVAGESAATRPETAASSAEAGKSSASAAQDPRTVLFALNKSEINSSLFDNARVLAAISALLGGQAPEQVSGITITSTGSPEGPEHINRNLSARRGAALRDYIVSEYPALAGKITVIPAGEAWEDFRIAVESDGTLSEASRNSILSIIVSNSSNDAKEQKLRSLPEWPHLLNDVFPGLRYARIQLDAAPAAEPAVLPEVPVLPGEDITVEDEPVAVNDTTLAVADSALAVPAVPVPAEEQEPVAEPVQEPAPAAPRVDDAQPLFALSTNLLYDLGGLIRPMSWTPNFALEVPFGQRWSLLGEYTFPWWVTDANDQAWQILKWDVGARFWFSRHNPSDRMDVLRGHFIGLNLSAGYYDIEPAHTGYQGELQAVGLEYGYAFRLARAWRIDLCAGFGWLGSHYRYYEADSADEHLIYQHHGKLQWFGPVKAGVSVKYIFHNNDGRAVR